MAVLHWARAAMALCLFNPLVVASRLLATLNFVHFRVAKRTEAAEGATNKSRQPDRPRPHTGGPTMRNIAPLAALALAATQTAVSAQTMNVQSLMVDGYTIAGIVQSPAGGAGPFLQKGNAPV